MNKQELLQRIDTTLPEVEEIWRIVKDGIQLLKGEGRMLSEKIPIRRGGG